MMETKMETTILYEGVILAIHCKLQGLKGLGSGV